MKRSTKKLIVVSFVALPLFILFNYFWLTLLVYGFDFGDWLAPAWGNKPVYQFSLLASNLPFILGTLYVWCKKCIDA